MDPTPISPELKDTISRLAINALTSLLNLDRHEHRLAMNRLCEDFGPYLGGAMHVWCHYAFKTIDIFADTTDAKLQILAQAWHIEDPDATHRWAARMFTASIRKDYETFGDGIDELNTIAGLDSNEAYGHLHSLLSLCAAVVTAGAFHYDEEHGPA